MPQRVGEYRDRVIIQKRTETRDVVGEPVRSWSQHAVRWAKKGQARGIESFEEDVARASHRNAQFRTHLTRGLDATMRLLYPGAVTTLASGVTTTGDTSLKVADADGFPLTGKYRVRVSDELMQVTDGQGTTTWTVTRAVDGTSAGTYATGQAVQLMQPYDVEDAHIDWVRGAETVISARLSDGIA